MNEHQIRTLTKNIISQIRLNKIILKTDSKNTWKNYCENYQKIQNQNKL